MVFSTESQERCKVLRVMLIAPHCSFEGPCRCHSVFAVSSETNNDLLVTIFQQGNDL